MGTGGNLETCATLFDCSKGMWNRRVGHGISQRQFPAGVQDRKDDRFWRSQRTMPTTTQQVPNSRCRCQRHGRFGHIRLLCKHESTSGFQHVRFDIDWYKVCVVKSSMEVELL